ncbi:MAG: class I SAM-dependent methyltransferase [Candidatus Eisenbacteria bacterium]
MSFRCKLCRADRHGRVFTLGSRPQYQAASCSECGLFQALYDWTAAAPPAVTKVLEAESGDWVSDAEMEAHAAKAHEFAARLEREGRVAGATVLDIGCGEGHFLQECARRGAARVVGQEFRLAPIRYARDHCGVADVRTAPLEDGSAWPDGEFDVVCSLDVVEHVHDLRGFFEQCLRVMRPDGYMLHVTPGSDSITHHLGRIASRLGAGGIAGTLTNVQHVSDLMGGPHVHLMGRRQVAWLAERHHLVAASEYVPSYSYSDGHYAAVVPQLRWMPRAIGTQVFRGVRRVIRNKLVFGMTRL